MPDRLAGINEKIRRAKQHVNDLESAIRVFLDRQPYRIVSEEQPETGKKLYRVRVAEQPPKSWATFIGDAVHNLRSALDHLAWQLVEAGGGMPGDQTAFPVGNDVKSLESELARRVHGAHPEAVDAIRRLQPYKGGNGDLLWRLHRLDIYDKHRLLLAIGAAYRHFALKVKMELPWKPGQLVEAPTIKIKPADRQFPLEDDAIVLSTSMDDEAAKIGYQFTFEVAFSDGEVVQGEPIMATLRQLVVFVESAIDPFRPFLT